MLLSTMIIKLTVESHQPLAVVADGFLLFHLAYFCFLPKADIRKPYKIRQLADGLSVATLLQLLLQAATNNKDTVRRYAPHSLLND